MLGRVASSYEANPHLQQELLQEISLAVWQSLTNFKGRSSLKTYILRIAHNKAVSHVAYYSRQLKGESYCEVESPQADLQLNSEEKISQTGQIERMLIAVRSLNLQARQIVTMSMEGLSNQEIAEVCGITPINVGVILNRARNQLMERLQNDQ